MNLKRSPICFVFLFAALTICFSMTAHAQATRTWVSGVGDDANPCSRTAPCKTFAGAISKTAAGGEIDALDPGGYGTITITKSIVIDGQGTLASILASGTNGVVVNLQNANDTVILRNLSINGAGTTLGVNGIRFIGAGTLIVENCNIMNFSNRGIEFLPNSSGALPSSAAQLIVRNTSIRNTIGTGGLGGAILMKPGAGFTASGLLENVHMERGTYGVRVEDHVRLTVRNSTSTNNTNNGFLAFSGGAAAVLMLEATSSTNNGTNGVSAVNGAASIRISNMTITNNATGVLSVSGGQIISFSNNRISGNTTDGAPTSTQAQQ